MDPLDALPGPATAPPTIAPSAFLAMLADGQPVVADGAMGTLLMAAGLTPGEAPESWNLRADTRDRVRAVHDAYIRAGARIVLTNTFGGSPVRLRTHGLADRSGELNRAAAGIAREAAGRHGIVAGSMGPLGELLAPFGTIESHDARAAFAVQAKGLADGGVDAIWIETMASLEEATAAVDAVRQVAPGLPIVVTMTFDSHGRTMMGTTPAAAATTLSTLGVAAIGANCGNGPDEIETAIAAMRLAVPGAVLVAKGNAGVPRLEGGVPVWDMTPDGAARHAVRVRALGAAVVGGCCGTTPAHIAAIADALGAPRRDAS